MEVKHTPGPWSLGADGEKITTNYRDEHGNMTDENWLRGGWAKHVARVSHATWMEPGESRANARLIAAAPDLLEAAKEAYEWMNGLPIPTTGCTAKMQVLYNAIAKAGEAK